MAQFPFRRSLRVQFGLKGRLRDVTEIERLSGWVSGRGWEGVGGGWAQLPHFPVH